MPRWLRYTLLGILALALLLVLLVWAAVALVNPNDFKPRIVALVEQKKQRTLTPRGDLKVTVFPRLGIEMNDVRLSEHRRPTEFAVIKRARFYLAWWPLLHKTFVVDGMRIEGLAVHLKRFPDGTTNFDDLLRSEDKSPLLSFAIDSVKVEGAAVTFDDVGPQRVFMLSNINFITGPLAKRAHSRIQGSFNLGISPPQGTARATFSSGLDMDMDAKRYSLTHFALSLNGTGGVFAGTTARMEGDAHFDGVAKTFAAKRLTLNMARPMFGAHGDIRLAADVARRAGRLKIDNLNASIKVPAPKHRLEATASIGRIAESNDSTAASPVSFAIEGQTRDRRYRIAGTGSMLGFSSGNIALRNMHARMALDLPDTSAKNVIADVTSSADIALKKQSAQLKLSGRFDQSNMAATFSVHGWQHPAVAFDVALDRLDVNRYKTKASGKASVDFSILKSWEDIDAEGTIRVGTLVLGETTARNAVLKLGEPRPQPTQ